MKMRRFILCLLSIVFISSPIIAKNKYVESLPQVDVDFKRYVGVWYEIARMPNYFEKNLVGVSATYTLNSDGTITVLNEGYQHTLKGKRKYAKGIAKILPNKKGALKVSFFRPFYAGYYVIDMADDYSYALVAGDNPDYLWILSREKRLESALATRLLEKAKKLGVSTEKMEWVEQ